MTPKYLEIIATMAKQGIPVSPFMYYWTLDELLRYYHTHS